MMVGAAFGLDVGQRSGILDTEDGIYVIMSLAHTKADSTKFVKELDEYRAKSVSAARQERVRSYLAALRNAAKVVDRREQVLQQAASQQAPPDV
jgi:hypothetical protein